MMMLMMTTTYRDASSLVAPLGLATHLASVAAPTPPALAPVVVVVVVVVVLIPLVDSVFVDHDQVVVVSTSNPIFVCFKNRIVFENQFPNRKIHTG
jgi:hypothetical protein